MKIAAMIRCRVGAESKSMATSAADVRVSRFHVVVEQTGTATLVDLLRIKLGFPKEVFECAVRPLIEGYADVVQLQPIPDSDVHPRPGGLFISGLERGSRALDYRRGQILPRGAAPEVIGAHAHRWSYAVLVAALLKGICSDVPDILEFNAVQIFERVVPPPVREWLSEDPALMREIVAVLTGDESASAGAIGELVRRAAMPSSISDPLPKVPIDQVATATHSGAGQPPEPEIVVDSAVSNAKVEFLEPVADEADSSVESVLVPESGSIPVSNLASRFMSWLQHGLADGSIRANQSGAFLHFVTEGMLLVSPRIFREFARQLPEASKGVSVDGSVESDIGKPIQRQLLRAGWHVRADNGVNILTYQVMRGERVVSRLSGIVISEPGRFIDTVLPINPMLVRSTEAREGDSPHGLSA